MSLEAPAESNGIDFIAFVREVWRTKWVFLGVLFAVTAAVFLAYFVLAKLNPPNVEAAAKPPEYAYFLYTSHHQLDPFGRTAPEILADFLDTLKQVDTLGLVSERDYFAGDFVPDRRFYVRPSDDYSGRIGIQIKNNFAPGTFEKAREAFLEAAQRQFEATRTRANGEMAMLKDFIANTYDKRSELIADKMYRVARFLDDSAVKAGSFRFFDFQPLQAYPPQDSATALQDEGFSAKRSFIISVIFGLIVASLFVVVRMEARRRKRPQPDAAA